MSEQRRDWAEPLQLGTQAEDKDKVFIQPIVSNLTAHIEGFQSIIKAVSNENFLEELSDAFLGLSLDLKESIKDSMIKEDKISLSEILFAAAEGQLSIFFTNGKIKFTKDNIDSIASIPGVVIKGNIIQVTVDGDAELAEETLKRVLLFFFEKASLNRSWIEIEKLIYCKKWRLSVEVDLEMPTAKLLHPDLHKILTTEIYNNINSYGDMLFDKNGCTIKHKKMLVIDPEIDIKVSIIDQDSGIIDNVSLEIDRSKTFHQGTGRMRVVADCNIKTLQSLLNKISKELK